MSLISLRRSEQDFYESAMKQSSAIMARAQSEANTVVGDMIKSICESHDLDPPVTPQGYSFTMVRNKKGQSIAMLWGKELKDWQEGNLLIDGGVYPPGLPIKTKLPANGDSLPSNGAAKGVDGNASPQGPTQGPTLTETVKPA